MLLRTLGALVCLVVYPVQACVSGPAEPVSATLPATVLAAAPRRISIHNNMTLAIPAADGVLALHSADNFALIDRLEHWPVGEGRIGAVIAQPVVLDSNYDGIADALYAVDVHGLLWFVRLQRSGFAEPELIADFSALQYQFEQPLQLVQTLSPAPSGQLQYLQLLLLTATDSAQNSMLIALKHRPGRLGAVTLHDLTDRSSIAADELRYGIDEPLWLQLLQSDGWYVQLSGQITARPQVYAGVVYFTSARAGAVNADCSLAAEAEPLLHALHLHHAGLVYQQRSRPIITQHAGVLALKQDDKGELQLVSDTGQSQQVLQTALQAISPACADCVVPLTAGQFPRLIRLATFQDEYGAH